MVFGMCVLIGMGSICIVFGIWGTSILKVRGGRKMVFFQLCYFSSSSVSWYFFNFVIILLHRSPNSLRTVTREVNGCFEDRGPLVVF